MFTAVAGEACAQSSLREPKVLPIESYEPNTLGYTWDSDDVGFLDFKLSVKYPVMPERICSRLENSRMYFAATTRFAQYLGTRDSSPVIGKRFNPKLIWRTITDWEEGRPATEFVCEKNRHRSAREYLDFSFGHESNGQSIDSPGALREAQEVNFRRDGHPEFALDQISRGWDYVELTYKSHFENHPKWTAYLTLKYFLPDGPLQGAAEEYRDWENDPQGKPRRSVNGVAALVKYKGNWECCNWLADPKFAFGVETGYRDIFRYTTVRAEAGLKLWELPFTLWAQSGYGSDLAQYYKKVTSFGLAIEIASF